MRNGLSQRIALEVYIRNSQSTRLRLVDSESRMYTSSAILLYIKTPLNSFPSHESIHYSQFVCEPLVIYQLLIWIITSVVYKTSFYNFLAINCLLQQWMNATYGYGTHCGHLSCINFIIKDFSISCLNRNRSLPMRLQRYLHLPWRVTSSRRMHDLQLLQLDCDI